MNVFGHSFPRGAAVALALAAMLAAGAAHPAAPGGAPAAAGVVTHELGPDNVQVKQMS